MIIQKAVLEMNWVEKLYNGFMATWEKSSHLKKIMIFLGIYTVIFGITFVLAYSPFLFNEKTNLGGTAESFVPLSKREERLLFI